jgi:hypothetical protein
VKNKDNILPQLMAAQGGNLDALFAAELKKYSALQADVASNAKEVGRCGRAGGQCRGEGPGVAGCGRCCSWQLLHTGGCG